MSLYPADNLSVFSPFRLQLSDMIHQHQEENVSVSGSSPPPQT